MRWLLLLPLVLLACDTSDPSDETPSGEIPSPSIEVTFSQLAGDSPVAIGTRRASGPPLALRTPYRREIATNPRDGYRFAARPVEPVEAVEAWVVALVREAGGTPDTSVLTDAILIAAPGQAPLPATVAPARKRGGSLAAGGEVYVVALVEPGGSVEGVVQIEVGDEAVFEVDLAQHATPFQPMLAVAGPELGWGPAATSFQYQTTQQQSAAGLLPLDLIGYEARDAACGDGFQWDARRTPAAWRACSDLVPSSFQFRHVVLDLYPEATR